eukprot:1584819-Rhodomonas_salina.1
MQRRIRVWNSKILLLGKGAIEESVRRPTFTVTSKEKSVLLPVTSKYGGTPRYAQSTDIRVWWYGLMVPIYDYGATVAQYKLCGMVLWTLGTDQVYGGTAGGVAPRHAQSTVHSIGEVGEE